MDKPDVVIPFVFTDKNNIVIKARLNESPEMDLMLHTATADVRLTEAAVARLKNLKFTDKTKVESWGGKSDSRFRKNNRLQIAGFERNDITVWEDKNSGVGTDGKFGLDFFENKIVEINFDQQKIFIYNRLPTHVSRFEKLKIENRNGDLLVEAGCVVGGISFKNQFLLHSGYAGGALLDDVFAAKLNGGGKLKILEQSALTDSFGNKIQVAKTVLPEMILGGTHVSNVPAGFFSGKIGNQKMSLIGGDVLKRFNILFDLADNSIYLSKSRFANS